METYAKLFSSITDSTIWAEDNETRIVWVTMLAMADKTGYVGASIPGVAARARVSEEAVEAALAKFMAPDRKSRSKDYEGRRVEEADRGWVLLNYERFRDMRDEEDKRRYERDKKRAQRAKGHVPECPPNVPSVPSGPLVSRHAQAYAQAQAENNREVPLAASPPPNIGGDDEGPDAHMPPAEKPAKGKRGPKPQPATACPASTDDGSDTFAARWGIPIGGDDQARACLDFHASKGNRYVRWDLVWRTWQRRQGDFARAPGPRSDGTGHGLTDEALHAEAEAARARKAPRSGAQGPGKAFALLAQDTDP